MTSTDTQIATGAGPAPEIGYRRRLLLASFAAHWPFLASIGAYWLIAQLLLALTPGTREIDFASFALGFVSMTLPVLLLALVTVRFFVIAVEQRPKHPAIVLARDVLAFLSSPSRLALGLPMLVSLTVLIQSYTVLKYNITAFSPFSWDETFMALDRTLHFGRHPWEWLQPLLGYPLVTFAVNLVYNVWFVVMWAFWVVLAFATQPSELRTRFFAAFILLWAVGGSIAAVAFSSAGPCYYAALGLAPDPYAGLMAYLHQAGDLLPIWALDTQALLWSAHTGEQNVVAGISAMPSLHNATALLFVLTAWRISRRLGAVLLAFAAAIFLGSVHLGWHYAVDAYLGWLMTLAAWWASGRFAAWNEARPASRALAALTALDRPAPPP